jgi:hypothetical protein
LTLGNPPRARFSNNKDDWRSDERCVESVYAGNVARAYLDLWTGLVPVCGLDCGASCNPEAVRIKEYWRSRHIVWDAVDANPVTADIYEERYQCRIGDLQETEYDLILCLSTLEHCAVAGDTWDAALGALRRALSGKGILILTVPVGIPLEMTPYLRQFSAADLSLELSQKFGIVDERFWLWDGDNYENVGIGETVNAMYGMTNEAVYAAAVGAWVLARRDTDVMQKEEAAGRCCSGDCECARAESGGRDAAPKVPWVRTEMGMVPLTGEMSRVQFDGCDGGGCG